MGLLRDHPASGRQRLDARLNDEIERHARVRISYQDVDGNIQTEASDGLRAVCHQHEIDQLNGMFWINRLSRLKRERLIKRFEKMSRS
jgi:peptide deformylase